MHKKLVVHPFLFASFASLSLMAANISQVGLAGLRALLISLLGALGIYLLMRFVLRDALKGGLAASFAILLFSSYGHVINVLENVIPRMPATLQHIILSGTCLGLFGLWFQWLRRGEGRLDLLHRYFTIVAVLLNIMPLISILTFSRQTPQVGTLGREYVQANVDLIQPEDVRGFEEQLPDPLPDIYFIVLDAYARDDVLAAYYGYDNRDLIEFLEARGFFVDSLGRSNYSHTDSSLASALNMIHLDQVPNFLAQHAETPSEDTFSRMTGPMIHANQAWRVFSQLGYTFAVFDSGYEITNIRDADLFMQSSAIEDAGLWEIGFEMMLLDTSFGRGVVRLLGDHFKPHERMFQAHRQRVIYALETLPGIADREGNFLVFAHVVSPHVPFVFGPNGEEITGQDPYTLLDVQPGNPENIHLYRDQLHYLNQLLMECVDEILAQSETPPIIIVQADHGGKVFVGDEPTISERMPLTYPILSAYLIPGAADALAESSPITPVNTLRVVLREAFHLPIELLDRTSYWVMEEQDRLAFIDACARYGNCGRQ